METIKAIEILDSPCMIITDADKEEFPEKMEVFTMPKAKYFWMNPLTQHIPFDLVSGYIGAIKGISAFRENDENFADDMYKHRLKDGTEIVIV